jgi:hypothetical protein
MDFVYAILAFLIFSIIIEYVVQYIFDVDYLFPIEGNYLNTVIIYVIFLGQLWQSWGSFEYESWSFFIAFWITTAVIAFFVELIVEQIRWKFRSKD